MPPGFNFLMNKYEPCECCKPRLTYSTSTIGRKWTKKEVEEHILYLAEKIATVKWYESRPIDELKHWVSKLQKINEVETEFDLTT